MKPGCPRKVRVRRGRLGGSQPFGEVGCRGAHDGLDDVGAAAADPFGRGAGEHAHLAVVGRDGAGGGVRAEDPFVAVDLGAGPVAVGDGAGVPADVFDRGVDEAGDRRTDAVGADDEPGVDGERAAVGAGAGHAVRAAVAAAGEPGDGDAEADVGARFGWRR